MPTQCSYEKIILGESRSCQLNVLAENLIELGGKNWCLFHLPNEYDGDKSEKESAHQSEEEWNRYVEDFNSAIFEYVSLRLNQIQRLAKSGLTQGDYEIDLSGVVFPGYVDFKKCPEIERGVVGMNLSGAVFNGIAVFSELNFYAVTAFIDTKFNRQADFNNSTFERVSFKNAFFHGVADFENVTINAIADFRNSYFNGEAVFTKLQSAGQSQINFGDAEFCYGSVFRQASFSGRVNFGNTLFGGGTYFDNVVFEDDVNFEQSEESRKKIPNKSISRNIVDQMWFVDLEEEDPGRWVMEKVMFHKRATFRGRDFLIPTSFNCSEFSLVPEFHDAMFNKDTTFVDAVFHDFTGHEQADAVGGYRALQQAAKTVVSKEDEINFAALHQNAMVSSPNTPLFHKVILLGFKYTGNFGRNLNRMLLLIVLTNFVFLVAYELISWSNWEEAGKCLLFTVNQVISPFSLWADSYIDKAQGFIVADIAIFRFLATIQSTICAFLVSALLWSVQLRFRIF